MTDVSAERVAELKDISDGPDKLEINKPIPKDLLPILAKDDDKQMGILMKNTSLWR